MPRTLWKPLAFDASYRSLKLTRHYSDSDLLHWHSQGTHHRGMEATVSKWLLQSLVLNPTIHLTDPTQWLSSSTHPDFQFKNSKKKQSSQNDCQLAMHFLASMDCSSHHTPSSLGKSLNLSKSVPLLSNRYHERNWPDLILIVGCLTEVVNMLNPKLKEPPAGSGVCWIWFLVFVKTCRKAWAKTVFSPPHLLT